MPPFIPRKRFRSISPEPGPSKSPAVLGEEKIGSARKPTLADALDGTIRLKRPLNSSKSLLAKFEGSDSESSLSSLTSPEPEFEDVPSAKRHRVKKGRSEVEVKEEEEDDEDEDIEFEDVHTHDFAAHSAGPIPSGDLDLTLTKETRISLINPHGKKQGPTKIERGIRISTHQMHVQFLMWHNAVRNAWICDKQVQEILVKQVSEGVKQQIDLWRVRSGLVSKVDESKGRSKYKSAKSQKGNQKVERNSRDWGEQAVRQARGEVDMSQGDPLFRLISVLTHYWDQRFRVTEPGLRKMGYMSLPRIDAEIKSFHNDKHDCELHGERIADINEFRERSKLCEGSRDLSAQLFTALLRGIGLEARLIASLQPVGFGWNKSEEAVERKEKKSQSNTASQKADNELSDVEIEDILPEIESSKIIKGKRSVVGTLPRQARKPSIGSGLKDAPIHLSEDDEDSVVDITPAKPGRGPSKDYEKDLPPNYWTEVLSPVTNTYVSCSTLLKGKPEVTTAIGVVTNPDALSFFEPRGARSEKAKQVMAYIIGYSQDGTAKDVTVRYLKRNMWPGKTKGMRFSVEKIPIHDRNGKIKRYEEYDWFKTVMSSYNRPADKRTQVDDHEEATDLKAVKPERKEVKEGDETLQSYKSSAEFVLERHLRREEAIVPGTDHVKMFTVKGKDKSKGEEDAAEEKVFLRKDVVKCKSIETWHKEGRAPKIGEQPLKRVPYRAATTNRKRELAEAEAASGGEKMLQGLYSWDQTDWIIPDPIVHGIIPKNAFNNIDLYVPSMLPQGAAHLPYRGMIKICKRLGIDFAEAVTGFEFGARMAIPIITGVVIAEENEEMVMEQWEKDEAERERKEDEKRTKAALGMWRKFLMGLRIVERVREEYGSNPNEDIDVLNPWTNKNKLKEGKVDEESRRRIMAQEDEDMAGGFFPEGHDEEAPPQNFFPTRHEDEDEEMDGGFVVEGHDLADKSRRRVEHAYNTPLSMELQKRPGLDSPEDEEEAASVRASESSYFKKEAQPSTRKSRAVPKPKVLAKTPRGKAKVVFSEDDNEEEDESSSLSDVDSGSGSEPIPTARAKGKRRVTLPAKVSTTTSSPASRTLPKRAAARRSDIGVRSKYFEHSDEDDG